MHRRLIPHAEAATVMHRESREGLPSQRPTDSSGLGRSAACSQGLGRSAYFALARHENPTDGNLVGRIAGTACGATGRKSTDLPCPTRPSRHEPIALARWPAGHEHREPASGFSPRASSTSRSRECWPRGSRSSQRVVRNAPAPAARRGRVEARVARFGMRGCSGLFVRRANEALHRTSASGTYM